MQHPLHLKELQMLDTVLARRKFLFASVGAASLAALGACTTSTTNIATEWSNFVDQVNQVLAAGCSSGLTFLATAESIASVVASLYGPGGTAIVGTISGAVTAVATDICSAVPANNPPASAALKAKLKGSSPGLPVTIGVTKHGVTVVGYHT
jgi:phage-related protein